MDEPSAEEASNYGKTLRALPAVATWDRACNLALDSAADATTADATTPAQLDPTAMYFGHKQRWQPSAWHSAEKCWSCGYVSRVFGRTHITVVWWQSGRGESSL